MQLGYIGLGKMGKNMALRLVEKGHDLVVWNRSPEPRVELEKAGAKAVDTIEDIVNHLDTPRVIWLMLPAGKVTMDVIHTMADILDQGDIVIDGSNNIFSDAPKHFDILHRNRIHFIDVGVSGGPAGARNGACLMIGGHKTTFDSIEPLFKDVAAENAYQFFEGHGAGHFVKMVHNGIEYGMMQAIAEGFNLMKDTPFNLNLKDVARIYNNRSVIESRLVEWLLQGFEKNGTDLDAYDGTVGHLGEGQWTVDTANEWNMPVPIIEGSLNYRIKTETEPDYIGKVLQSLRTEFGGKRDKGDKPPQ